MRTFATGATRDSDDTKIDPEGFFSVPVFRRYCEYMNRHRKQADGTTRDSDNWQAGIPRDAYMKSMWRHFVDVWADHRGYPISTGESVEDELCALIFNAMGYLHETLKIADKATTVAEPYALTLPESHPLRHVTLPREHGA